MDQQTVKWEALAEVLRLLRMFLDRSKNELRAISRFLANIYAGKYKLVITMGAVSAISLDFEYLILKLFSATQPTRDFFSMSSRKEESRFNNLTINMIQVQL